MAGASRQQGDVLLNLFHPDHDNFWWDYCRVSWRYWFIVSGQRQRFPVSTIMRWLLVLSDAAAALAAAVMAERRVTFDADYRPADRRSLYAASAAALASRRPQSLFFRKIRFNGTFADPATQQASNKQERIES